MVSDPCNGPLVKGLYGDHRGVLTRLRNTISPPVPNSSYSYVLWNPACKSPAATAANQSFNLVWFCTDNAVYLPSSTSWGYNNTLGGIYSVNDPESVPLYAQQRDPQSGIADVSRTLAACMKATYVGSQANFQGMVYPITNFPIDNLGNVTSTLSCQNLRTYTTTGSREFEHEVRYTPCRASSEYSGSGAQTSRWLSNASVPGGNETFQPDATAIGFLFWNCDPLDFTIDVYKVVEWVPNLAQGMPAPPIENVGSYDTFSRVAKSLNTVLGPEWATAMMDSGMNAVVNALSSIAIGGVGSTSKMSRPRLQF